MRPLRNASLLLLPFSLLFFPCQPVNSEPEAAPGTAAVRPVATPLHPSGSSKALLIHKPMPDPAWGRLVQYRKDQIFALSEEQRETLYEFVFQDDRGIIRTAVYHEGSNGSGYWEVMVWDQP